jgi:hypothetical protein
MNHLSLFRHRFGPVALVILLVIITSFLTRLYLFIDSWNNLEWTFGNIVGIFLIGILYDVIVGLFFAVPVNFYCWLMKDSFYQAKWNRVPLFIYFFLVLFILLLNICSEIAFWNEFDARYNFIAVDYLIYTNEVLANIWQSYNIPIILAGVIILAGICLFNIRNQILASQDTSLRFSKRSLSFFLILLSTASGIFF